MSSKALSLITRPCSTFRSLQHLEQGISSAGWTLHDLQNRITVMTAQVIQKSSVRVMEVAATSLTCLSLTSGSRAIFWPLCLICINEVMGSLPAYPWQCVLISYLFDQIATDSFSIHADIFRHFGLHGFLVMGGFLQVYLQCADTSPHSDKLQAEQCKYRSCSGRRENEREDGRVFSCYEKYQYRLQQAS